MKKRAKPQKFYQVMENMTNAGLFKGAMVGQSQDGDTVWLQYWPEELTDSDVREVSGWAKDCGMYPNWIDQDDDMIIGFTKFGPDSIEVNYATFPGGTTVWEA